MWSISIQQAAPLNYPCLTIITIIIAVSFLCHYFNVIFSRPVSIENTRVRNSSLYWTSLNSKSFSHLSILSLSSPASLREGLVCWWWITTDSLLSQSQVIFTETRICQMRPRCAKWAIARKHICTQKEMRSVLFQHTGHPIAQLFNYGPVQNSDINPRMLHEPSVVVCCKAKPFGIKPMTKHKQSSLQSENQWQCTWIIRVVQHLVRGPVAIQLNLQEPIIDRQTHRWCPVYISWEVRSHCAKADGIAWWALALRTILSRKLPQIQSDLQYKISHRFTFFLSGRFLWTVVP